MVFGIGRYFGNLFTHKEQLEEIRKRNTKYTAGTSTDHAGLARCGSRRKRQVKGKNRQKSILRKNSIKRATAKRVDLRVKKRGLKSKKRASTNDDPPSLETSTTPMGLLKKIWHLKNMGSEAGKRRNKKVGRPRLNKRNDTNVRKRGERTKSTKQIMKREPRKRQALKRSPGKRSTKSTKQRKSIYPKRTRDLRCIKVRRIKRYVTGEDDYERPQLRPIVSLSKERDRLVQNKPKLFILKSLEKANDSIKEDPLNVHDLHRSYVSDLYGTPAHKVEDRCSSRRGKARKKRKEHKVSAKKQAERAFQSLLKRRGQRNKVPYPRLHLKSRNKHSYKNKRPCKQKRKSRRSSKKRQQDQPL